MEEGFITDRTRGAVWISTWVKGKPEHSGLKDSGWAVTKIGDKEQLPIRTFRCPKCGYLESYADA
jgi:hypothetical protein